MDMQQMRAFLSVTNRRLDLQINDLHSATLSQLLAPYCVDGVLHVREVTDPGITDGSITISGVGDAFPFRDMPLTAVFTLDENQDITVSITVTGLSGWTLAQSFPALQGSIFTQLVFALSPTLSLSLSRPAATQTQPPTSAQPPTQTQPSSQDQSSGQSQPATLDQQALFLDGTLDARSPLANLHFLFGNTQPVIRGSIGMISEVTDIPVVALYSPTSGSVSLDFFTLANVEYALYCDPIYNTFNLAWQADCYIALDADITFHAQNKDYTITLSTDIYDLSSNILFVADITDGIEAAIDELASLANGLSLQLPSGWVNITNHVTLTDLLVSVNPTGAQKINYIALKLETVEEWTLIPDLVELQAIDINFRVDAPLSHPVVSGSVSGLIGIGETGTLELTAFFGEFAFGGALREGDPLSLQEVFEHFLSVTDTTLPQLNIEAFNFYVQPADEIYSGDIELVDVWAILLGNGQTISIERVYFHLNHPGKGQVTTFDAQGWFSISGVLLAISASYGGPSAGWTFSGESGPGQALPIGTLIADLAASFDSVTLPAAIADLIIDNLAISFNTLTKHFTFACATATSIDSTPVSLTIFIDILPTGQTYTKTFGGTITIGTRQFALLFSEDATAAFFLATYANPGGEKIRLKEDLVAPLSPTAALDIPEGLELDFKDVLFVLEKGAAAAAPTFVLGLDLGVHLPSLSNLPLVGATLSVDQSISLDYLRVLIASQPVTPDALALINGLLSSDIAPLPSMALASGLTLAAALNFGGNPQMLMLPVAGAPLPTPMPATTPVVSTTTMDGAIWFPLQKAFGPVHFNRVGMQYQDAALWFLLDAALSFAGLTLSLEGLSFGSPLSHFAPAFQLRGLGLSYQEGPVEIGGAFLHVREKLPNGTTLDEYEGLAIIKTEELTISALGAYADLAGNPSLFLYAVLDYPLGGPTFFFITGLAAGIGYNRALRVPPITQVNQFPLVVDAVSGAIPAQNARDLGVELAKFDQYISPELGEIFFAIGIRYTSFKIIDSFALLTVAIGNEFEIDILGLSTLILPTPVPDAPNPTPLAVVQMAVKASYMPALGFLGVSAQLTTASYLLSSSCHLTGGFAFYSWLAGEHAGDFVQTLGGYHPSFVVPAHYPTVPRLGFQWQVDNSISIKGEAYCALTASAMMAGMHVQATWQSGDLRAWFNAAFDFLLSWKPFYYDISLSIDLGASYTFTFFGTHTISVDVGADLHIWGPEFSGWAHIKLSVISFDVAFGANASSSPTPIDWPTFKKSFLPDDSAVVGVSVKAGMVSKQSANTSDLGVLDPKQFALVTNTLVPATRAHIQQDVVIAQRPGPIAIGSMGVQASELASTHIISITRNGKNVEQDFAFTPVFKSAPVGLWGHSLTPDLNGPRFVDNALTGFEITPATAPTAGETAVINTSKLRYEAETIASAYHWTPNPPAFQADTLDDGGSRQKIGATLTSPAVSAAREQLLRQLGLSTASVDLSGAQALVDGFVFAPQVEKL